MQCDLCTIFSEARPFFIHSFRLYNYEMDFLLCFWFQRNILHLHVQTETEFHVPIWLISWSKYPNMRRKKLLQHFSYTFSKRNLFGRSKKLPHKLYWKYELTLKLKLLTKTKKFHVENESKQLESFPDVRHQWFSSFRRRLKKSWCVSLVSSLDSIVGYFSSVWF